MHGHHRGVVPGRRAAAVPAIAQPVLFDLSVPALALTVAAPGPATLVELHSSGAPVLQTSGRAHAVQLRRVVGA